MPDELKFDEYYAMRNTKTGLWWAGRYTRERSRDGKRLNGLWNDDPVYARLYKGWDARDIPLRKDCEWVHVPRLVDMRKNVK